MKPGTRLRSTVCATEVMVIRVDDPSVVVACGGAPMVAAAGAAEAPAGTPEAGHDTGSLIGKRYGDARDPVELLCTKAGAGSLSVDGRLLHERHAKPLPASD